MYNIHIFKKINNHPSTISVINSFFYINLRGLQKISKYRLEKFKDDQHFKKEKTICKSRKI